MLHPSIPARQQRWRRAIPTSVIARDLARAGGAMAEEAMLAAFKAAVGDEAVALACAGGFVAVPDAAVDREHPPHKRRASEHIE